MRSLPRTVLIWIVLAVGPAVLLSCGTTSESSSDNDPTVISHDEIEDVGEISDAYNLVQRLEPQWLRKRGRSSIQQPGDIIVYLEDNRQGGPESLRQMDVIDIESIEFLRPDKATMRYGSGHDHGAILVHLKSGR